MKKLLAILVILLACNSVFAFYDFCESPADYNTFPAAYDVKTEYWKDIPKYNENDVKYKDMNNKNPIFPFSFKKKQKPENNDSAQK